MQFRLTGNKISIFHLLLSAHKGKNQFTGLPFILQGDFIPDADRNHIRSDFMWNHEILKNLGVLLAKVVQTCSQTHEIELPDLVPWEQNISPVLEPFTESFKKTMIKTAFRLKDATASIDLEDYVICGLDTRFLSQKDLRSILLSDCFRLFLEPDSALRRCLEWLGVRTLTADDIFRILLEKAKRTADPSWFFNCCYSLAEADNRGDIDEELLDLMKNKGWLLKNNRRFTIPHDRLYFRMPRAKKRNTLH